MKERSKELLFLAALPMYDFPELAWATDAWWAAIAGRLGVSLKLTRGRDLHAVWTDPALLLAQTCGYPFATSLRGRVTLVATPCYTAPGCEGALYRSAIIVRDRDSFRSLEDLRGRRCAVNDPASNSGMNMLRGVIAPFAPDGRFFDTVVTTGSHAASVEAVAGDVADVAAIDCITWAHLQNLHPGTANCLRVLDWTPPTLGLPLITSVLAHEATQASLMAALQDAARDPSLSAVREALYLKAFLKPSPDAYVSLLDLEAQAKAAFYPFLN